MKTIKDLFSHEAYVAGALVAFASIKYTPYQLAAMLPEIVYRYSTFTLIISASLCALIDVACDEKTPKFIASLQSKIGE